MKKIFFLAGMLIFCALPALSQPSSMVEKHIFMPSDSDVTGSEIKKTEKPDAHLKNSNVQLTGIILTPKAKKAVFSVKEKSDKDKARKVCLEGESVTDQILLQTIGTNYVLVTHNNVQMRMNLFGGEKQRPAPLPEPVMPAREPAPPDAINESLPGEPNQAAEVPSPFGGNKKRDLPRTPESGTDPRRKIPRTPASHEKTAEGAVTSNPADMFKQLTERNSQRKQTGDNPLMDALGAPRSN